MRVCNVRLDSGNEVIPILVGEGGLPIDRLNTYILQELRGAADTTVSLEVTKLIHIERWAARQGVLFADEMATSCLADNLLFKSLIRHLENYADKNDGSIPLKRKKVVPDYFDARIESCIQYFTYLHEQSISKRFLEQQGTIELERAFKRLLKRFEKEKLHDRSESSKSGLTKLQQATLFHGLKNRLFRFRSATELRNEVIIHLFYETGIRDGELLSLTIPNCHTRVKSAYIVVEQNIEYDDPRGKVPHVKTKERLIPISKFLANLIDEYKVVRSKPKAAKRQPPYLFLSSEAPYNPLSFSSVQSVFDKIKKQIPALDKFGPHILRHTFFENLDLYLYSKGYDEVKKTKIKNALGGWSPTSKTHLNYEKNATLQEANEALSELHDLIENEPEMQN